MIWSLLKKLEIKKNKYRKCTHNLTLSFSSLTAINVNLYSFLCSALYFIVCGLSGSAIHNIHIIWKEVEFRKKE